jgi:hypothetical protein
VVVKQNEEKNWLNEAEAKLKDNAGDGDKVKGAKDKDGW